MKKQKKIENENSSSKKNSVKTVKSSEKNKRNTKNNDGNKSKNNKIKISKNSNVSKDYKDSSSVKKSLSSLFKGDKTQKVNSQAVKKYKKKKAKKDKKKRIINGRFSLDILDLLIIVIITVIISCVFTGIILNFQFKKNSNLYDSNVVSDKDVQDFLNTYTEIVDNYYEEVDKDELMKAAMSGMLSFLEDNYSIYLDKTDSDELSEMLDSSYEGLGVVVAGVKIEDIYEDSPAEKAGMKVGDEIIEVNGSSISIDNYEDIDGLISLDDENIIKVLRDNKEYTFKVTADTINIPTTKKDLIKSTDGKSDIGYIELSSFSSLSFEEFQEDLLELEKDNINSLIIDLRGNSGGYLNTAYDIASLFIEKGGVIYSLENKNTIKTYKDETNTKRDYKVVVLVNSNTASAAEILTAALHDTYGAIVVGNTTYGKGKVQNIKYYEDSILKYTSAKWLRPNGECVDEVGIKPDYNVNITIKGNTLYDLQLDKAIELLS